MTWIAWIMGSRLGRSVAAAAALLLAVVTFGASQRRKGRKEGVERVSRRADAAAEKRKELRGEIDRDTDARAARDRLREDWSD